MTENPWPFPDIPRPRTRAPIMPPETMVESVEADRDAVFVREFLKLEGRDEAAIVTAYRRAGYFNPAYPIAVAADRQFARPEIQAAIEAGRSIFKISPHGEISRESIVADLEEVFGSSLQKKDHNACVNAKRAQAQILGYMEQSVTVTHRMDITQLSDAQLERIAAKSNRAIEGQAKDITPRGIGHLAKEDGG